MNFKYVGFPEDDGLDCTTLRARAHGHVPAEDIVVVEFVDRYGERAHHLLADFRALTVTALTLSNRRT